VINVRAADRVEDVDGGSAGSGPPVIDLANRRLRFRFMLPEMVRLKIVAKFLLARGYKSVMVSGWK
jgi:hypothetical protein